MPGRVVPQVRAGGRGVRAGGGSRCEHLRTISGSKNGKESLPCLRIVACVGNIVLRNPLTLNVPESLGFFEFLFGRIQKILCKFNYECGFIFFDECSSILDIMSGEPDFFESLQEIEDFSFVQTSKSNTETKVAAFGVSFGKEQCPGSME